MEHGASSARPATGGAGLQRGLVEQVARKVNAEIPSASSVKSRPAIVSEVAERIVREEIERIKQSVLRGSR